MKTKINALVVDDSMEFTSSVKEYFKNNAVIKIVDVVTDGEKAVDYIKEHQDNIDVILMDLIIPGKDGLQILEELEELKIKKHLIILSSYRKDYTIRMTSRFNVDYYMLKPINLSSLDSPGLIISFSKLVFTATSPDIYQSLFKFELNSNCSGI